MISKVYDSHEARKLGFDEEDDSEDFLSSVYCPECAGWGFYRVTTEDPRGGLITHKRQCPECEELHRAELLADRMLDEAKEGA